jgi:hypothetical protein
MCSHQQLWSYDGSCTTRQETAMMLSLTRSFHRPAFARSLAQRAAALHTLPELPYQYNVKWSTPHQMSSLLMLSRRWSRTSLPKL